MEYFTKFTEVYVIPNNEAETVRRILAEEVFPRYGVPLQVVTDQGKEFENRLLRGLCDSYGFEMVRTSPYRPSTDGAIERLHRLLMPCWVAFLTNHRKTNVRVPAVMAAYRASQHEATGILPTC